MATRTKEASNKEISEEILPKRPSAVLHAIEVQERKIERRRDLIIRHYSEAISVVNIELAELQARKSFLEQLLAASRNDNELTQS